MLCSRHAGQGATGPTRAERKKQGENNAARTQGNKEANTTRTERQTPGDQMAKRCEPYKHISAKAFAQKQHVVSPVLEDCGRFVRQHVLPD